MMSKWVVAIAVVVGGCSGSVSEPAADDATAGANDAAADSGSGGDAGEGGTRESGSSCVGELERVAKDDSQLCCGSLVKACVSVAMANTSPCICSRVACGTASAQPPPNVPCCPGLRTDCTSGVNGGTQCTCGP